MYWGHVDFPGSAEVSDMSPKQDKFTLTELPERTLNQGLMKDDISKASCMNIYQVYNWEGFMSPVRSQSFIIISTKPVSTSQSSFELDLYYTFYSRAAITFNQQHPGLEEREKQLILVPTHGVGKVH